MQANYRVISLNLYVIPLLDVEMGLGNKLCNEFVEWIKNNVENIKSDEMRTKFGTNSKVSTRYCS